MNTWPFPLAPLPPEVQKISAFAAGVGTHSPDPACACKVIEFLVSAEARQAIAASGLEPVSA